jgi:tetratricopeptide (TPR) repeat protein
VIGIPLWRRCAIAVVALPLAACCFHSQVASALITRGDDAMRNGDRTAGIGYYARALALDAQTSRAADRLAFTLAMRREPGDAQAAIAVATNALVRTPNDAALLADRGLAEQRLDRWRAAETDFIRAGAAAHDARFDHLAGRIALRLGNIPDAKRLFARALLVDRTFAPARAALARLRR